MYTQLTKLTDRNQETSGYEDIQAWTKFDFEGRNNEHSDFTWNKSHFSGVDWDDQSQSKSIWKFEGKAWATDASPERGSFDYL